MDSDQDIGVKTIRNESLHDVGATGASSNQFVRFSGTYKIYGQGGTESIVALENISLTIAKNEFVTIVGPSGCGKSILLLLLAGLVPASKGTIAIGDDVVQEPYTDLGMVFQDPVLLDWRNVRRNLLIQAEIRGLERTWSSQRADDLLELVGLSGFAKRYPYELSGGMRQRVAICRALLHDPPLLLMDEPFGALDAITRDQLNVDLAVIWSRSEKTVLFVTHSITEAVFLSERVIVLSPRPGQILADLTIDLPRPRRLEVRETEAFARYTREIREIFSSQGVIREDVH